MKLTLTQAVQGVLLKSPFSWRELAQSAGVSHSLLAYIAKGQREATPAVAQKLLKALDDLAEETQWEATLIRRALQASGSPPRPRPRRRTRS